MNNIESRSQRENYFDHQTIRDILTPEQCEQVIEFSRIRKCEPTVYVDKDSRIVRNSDVWWLPENDETRWLFELIHDEVRKLNDDYYYFDLDENTRMPFQLTYYKARQFYGWHNDIGKGSLSRRKLTVSVQLTDPSTYVGNNLQFHGHEDTLEIAPRDRGAMTVFPSFRSHCVTKAVWGDRWSLVGWIEGPPFR